MTTIRSGFLLTLIRMNLNDIECRIRFKVHLMDGTLDVRMLWLSELTMCDWMNMSVKFQRQKVVNCSFWAKEVCMTRGLLHRRQRTGVEPLKLVIFHLMQRHSQTSWRMTFCNIYLIMKALNCFLVTQRQMTLKDVWVWCINVRKLHRPCMLDAFLADTCTVESRYDLTIVVQHLRFCSVLCIARSVSQPANALLLCGS